MKACFAPAGALALSLAACPALAAPDDAGWRFYNAGQFAEARTVWDAEARTGDADAQFGLGLLYDLGQGVPPDNGKACALYEQAGDAGHALGAFNAAVMHDSGRCGPDRTEAAATWYARAAAAGVGRAQFNLGQLYAAGEGVPRNPALAAAWFRAAAASGISAAAGRVPTVRPAAASGTLLGVQPVSPTDAARVPAGPGVPLVWTVAAEPGPVQFFLEVMALDPAGLRPVLRRTTELSATLVSLPPEPGRYAWRVSAVAEDVPHYVPGPWRAFLTVAAGTAH